MKEIVAIHRTEILDLLAKNGTKFIGVTFIKKNGEERRMNANPSPAPKENSQGLGYDPSAKGLKLMFDMVIRQDRASALRRGNVFKDEGYRMVTIDKITELRMNKKIYTVLN